MLLLIVAFHIIILEKQNDANKLKMNTNAQNNVIEIQYEPRHEETNVLVSDLVRHKPGYIATEDGQRLDISDLESRGIVLSM